MKITFLSTLKAYWGGCEELWTRCAELAIREGHQVQVVVYKQQHHLHPSLQKLRKISTSFIELENDILPTSLFKKIYNRLKNKVFPPDLNHIEKFFPGFLIVSQAYNYDAAFYDILYSFLVKLNKPFFLVSQFNFEHKGLSITEIEKARTIFNKARNIFFVSVRNKEVSERQLAKQIFNAKYIDNPLNLDNHSYIPYNPAKSEICFASVARLEIDYKGQDILLQILNQKKWKERRWHFNMYGSGEDEKYLLELIAFYGLMERVTLNGQVSDIRKVWQNNHALLMPSTSEGKPLAIEEAMICGRIVIASDVAGNSELIDDGTDGYIASSYFPIPFDQALERAWKEQNKWEEMGKLAHDKMVRKLDLNPHKTLLRNVVNAIN